MNEIIELEQLANNYIFIWSDGEYYPERFYSIYRQSFSEVSLEEFLIEFFDMDHTPLLSSSLVTLTEVLENDEEMIDLFFLTFIPAVARTSNLEENCIQKVVARSRKYLMEYVLKNNSRDSNLDDVYLESISNLFGYCSFIHNN